jgi:hypothetical protein
MFRHAFKRILVSSKAKVDRYGLRPTFFSNLYSSKSSLSFFPKNTKLLLGCLLKSDII